MTASRRPAIKPEITREDWLRRAARTLGQMIHQVSGIELPDFHVSMGFGGQRYEKNTNGVCWHTSASSDGKNHVFISPELDDTAAVLAVLLHELIHVALNNEDGHRKRFAEYATRVGLEAPFTCSIPSIELTAELMVIAHELGEFPHGKLSVPVRTPVTAPVPVGPDGEEQITSGPKAQTNRWISFSCPVHDVPVRMSRTRAAGGAPLCGHDDEDGRPCGTRMQER